MRRIPIEFGNQCHYIVRLANAGGHPILHMMLYSSAFDRDPEYRYFIDDDAIDIFESLVDPRTCEDEKGEEIPDGA